VHRWQEAPVDHQPGSHKHIGEK
jgi:hypothetical protein